MKKLLITGFEPFGGEDINPSWEAVKLLPDVVDDYFLTKICIPVEFGSTAKYLIEQADKICPDVILCIGQAGGRNSVTPEMLGINLRYAKIPDNNGFRPQDEAVIFGGEAAHFSTLPVRRMTEAIDSVGIPAQVSYSAGAYVCNDLLYTLLDHFKGSSTRVGFIHVPYSKEQNKEPSMELKDIARALTAAIQSIDN